MFVYAFQRTVQLGNFLASGVIRESSTQGFFKNKSCAIHKVIRTRNMMYCGEINSKGNGACLLSDSPQSCHTDTSPSSEGSACQLPLIELSGHTEVSHLISFDSR